MKREQDEHIDTLSERVRREREATALVEAQLLAQRQESAAAADALAEAHAAMESLSAERRGLVGEHKSAVQGLKRRDEALHAAEAALAAVLERDVQVDAEERALSVAITKASERREAIKTAASKAAAAAAAAAGEQEQSRARGRAAEERGEALAAAVEEVDQERAQMEGEAKALRTEVAQLVKECERIDGVKASKPHPPSFLPISHMSWLPICHTSSSPVVSPRFPHVSPGMSDWM